jgi:hypothetical protein
MRYLIVYLFSFRLRCQTSEAPITVKLSDPGIVLAFDPKTQLLNRIDCLKLKDVILTYAKQVLACVCSCVEAHLSHGRVEGQAHLRLFY